MIRTEPKLPTNAPAVCRGPIEPCPQGTCARCEGPRYSHDCDACIFLGREDDFDVYLCPDHVGGKLRGTLLARWSSNGPDYWSMPREVAIQCKSSTARAALTVLQRSAYA
jgi:hypothetical protein